MFCSALIAIVSYPCLPLTTPRLPHDVLIPAVRGTLRDLARVMGWGMNLVSVTRSWGKAEGHFPGISQRTASPGSVQIHVEGPNRAAVWHCVFTSADVSKSYIRGWSARAYRDGHGRNTHMDELRHMAIRLLHVHSFPIIPGRRNLFTIGQERRFCVANPDMWRRDLGN